MHIIIDVWVINETITTITSACVYLLVIAMVGEEPQQSSVDGNKATLTRRCFSWVRDINLRVCFSIISILSYIDLTVVPVVHTWLR